MVFFVLVKVDDRIYGGVCKISCDRCDVVYFIVFLWVNGDVEIKRCLVYCEEIDYKCNS